MANGSTETQFRLIRNFKDANGMFRKDGKKASWTWYVYEILKFKGHVFDLGSGKITPMKACGMEDKELVAKQPAYMTGMKHNMDAELAYKTMINGIKGIENPGKDGVMILATGNWRANDSIHKDLWATLVKLFDANHTRQP